MIDWIDIEDYDHDLNFKHILVKTDEDKVYCGYFGNDCADGDPCFSFIYFKDNRLFEESDWDGYYYDYKILSWKEIE